MTLLVISVQWFEVSSVEQYEKGETRVIQEEAQFSDLDPGVLQMKVNYGSKIRNLMGYAMKKIKEPEVVQIMWNGHGAAVPKAISCAEIMKRKIKDLHQVTNIRCRRIEEYWEPKLEGLERLKVNRDLSSVSILLSKVPVDSTQPGYQAPGVSDAFWKRPAKDEHKPSRDKQKGKRPFDPSKDKGQFDPPSLSRKRKPKGGQGSQGKSTKGADVKSDKNVRKQTGTPKREKEKSNKSESRDDAQDSNKAEEKMDTN